MKLFNSIFLLKIKHYDTQSLKLIPIEWQMVLFNEGSFTQNLTILTGSKINIKMKQKYNYISKKKNIRNLRYVWLENSIYTKLTFAQSLWIFKYKDELYQQLKYSQPIGQLLINTEQDVCKQILEIYYGYCQYIEKYFKINQPIWGRKCLLYTNYKTYAIIQEFFSPYIINFCSLK
uniref:Ycf21 n=1 Tax=Pleonosporium borreri TaxID=2575635 RepID=A0A4D6WX83_9FLOR|nr:hypothetical protein [Pleonosporium borreri]